MEKLVEFYQFGGVPRDPLGSILDRPTIFRTGRGFAVGGEIDDEAILPLGRDPRGRLGVVVADRSSTSRSETTQTFNITVRVDGGTRPEEARRTGRMLADEIRRGLEGRRGRR